MGFPTWGPKGKTPESVDKGQFEHGKDCFHHLRLEDVPDTRSLSTLLQLQIKELNPEIKNGAHRVLKSIYLSVFFPLPSPVLAQLARVSLV